MLIRNSIQLFLIALLIQFTSGIYAQENKTELMRPLQILPDSDVNRVSKNSSPSLRLLMQTLKQESKKGTYSENRKLLMTGADKTKNLETARLIGKELNSAVYHIDLSKVVSKYIGETEKNLSAIFDAAENNNWILFFDEADVLFGKRTEVKDAHDKYANQEVSYLLQRIEEYKGIVILATNNSSEIDKTLLQKFRRVDP